MYTEKQVETFLNLMRIRNDEMELQRIPFEVEQTLLKHVKNGEYEKINFKSFHALESNMGKIAPTTLLHFQFTAVAAITLFSRAAIESGVRAEEAFDLSDALLFCIANTKTPDECHQMFQLSAIMFAKRVHKTKNQDMPYHINKICTYISRNIYHKITIEDIAEYVNLSPNYMCKMFADHMNITIHNYIQREKVQITCNFLSQTELPITTISTYMGFKTISNFSIIFKKWMGVSPTEYRNREYKEIY